MRLHHLALGAHDLAAVAAFWRDVLGLEESARHHQPDGALRSVWLKLTGDALLMIERAEQPAAPLDGPVRGHGYFLLALSVSVQERAQVEARLEALGHAVEARTAYTSYFRDPEGNRAAISHYPEQ